MPKATALEDRINCAVRGLRKRYPVRINNWSQCRHELDAKLPSCAHCDKVAASHRQWPEYVACKATLNQLTCHEIVGKACLLAIKNSRNGMALHVPEMHPARAGESWEFRSSIQIITSDWRMMEVVLQKAEVKDFRPQRLPGEIRDPREIKNKTWVTVGRSYCFIELGSNRWQELRDLIDFLLPFYPREGTFLQLAPPLKWMEQCEMPDTWI